MAERPTPCGHGRVAVENADLHLQLAAFRRRREGGVLVYVQSDMVGRRSRRIVWSVIASGCCLNRDFAYLLR
jgi:hypothetical protein